MRNYQTEGEPIITRDRHIIKVGDWLSLTDPSIADDFIVKEITSSGFYTARVIWDDEDPNGWKEESYTEFVPENESKYFTYE